MSFARRLAPSRTSRRRHAAVVSGTVALSLALAACGGDDKESNGTDEPTKGINTASATMLNGEWPLTGEKLDGDLPQHPVYVVKIDNTTSSEPQSGLSSADMIVEELVEGGLTRLAVFYYEHAPDRVGPVRSMRASDIGIVTPVSAVVVASGAAPKTTKRITGAGIAALTEGSSGFFRDDALSAPYNLFTDLTKAADEPPDTWEPPSEPYLTFGDAADFKGTVKVRKMAAAFSGGHTTDWVHTDKGWTRPGSHAADGDDFVADNVLMLRVRVGDAGYRDPIGNPVPETKFVGKGDAILVHGDKALKCTWSKKSMSDPLRLKTKDGKEVSVPAGHTWIELVPGEAGNVTLTK